MSDVEFMTQRNWEQRRHAEEYAAQLKENKVIRLDRADMGDPSVSRKVDSSPYAGELRKRNKGGMAKAARAAGRIAMVVSAASALAGLELLFPLFGLVAVIFYALHFELKGDEKLWHRI